METNKTNQKTQMKTETLIMNAAQDIKILNMCLQFRGGCIQNIFPGMKSLAEYKNIFNLQRKNILENRTKIKRNFYWLKTT